jgi:hypothetical protein
MIGVSGIKSLTIGVPREVSGSAARSCLSSARLLEDVREYASAAVQADRWKMRKLETRGKIEEDRDRRHHLPVLSSTVSHSFIPTCSCLSRSCGE